MQEKEHAHRRNELCNTPAMPARGQVADTLAERVVRLRVLTSAADLSRWCTPTSGPPPRAPSQQCSAASPHNKTLSHVNFMFANFLVLAFRYKKMQLGICGSKQGCANLAAQARTVATHVIGYTVRLFKLATSAAPSAGSPLSRRCAASTFTTARTPSRQFHANARQRHRDSSNMNRSAD